MFKEHLNWEQMRVRLSGKSNNPFHHLMPYNIFNQYPSIFYHNLDYNLHTVRENYSVILTGRNQLKCYLKEQIEFILYFENKREYNSINLYSDKLKENLK